MLKQEPREAGSVRDPRATRNALTRAATDLFATQGFDGTSTEQIARKSGVNKALISYHYGGKAGLYRAILSSTFEEVSRRLEEIEARVSSPPERLRAFIAEFGEMHRDRPTLSAMILREVLSGGLFLDDRVLPPFLGVFTRVRKLVADGIRDGAFRPVDPLLTHLTLIGSLVFFFATRPLRERLIAENRIPVASPSQEEFVRHLQEMMARALTATPVSGNREST